MDPLPLGKFLLNVDLKLSSLAVHDGFLMTPAGIVCGGICNPERERERERERVTTCKKMREAAYFQLVMEHIIITFQQYFTIDSLCHEVFFIFL